MNKLFWTATALYYFSTGMMTLFPGTGWSLAVALFFFIVPSTTEVELVPGVETSMQAQLDSLKTQRYLSRNSYYEK